MTKPVGAVQKPKPVGAVQKPAKGASANPPVAGAQDDAKKGPFDSLGLLDLLYAVPVGDLAVRVSSAELGAVSNAAWAYLAVCLTTLGFSWIGLHHNRAEMTMAERTAADNEGPGNRGFVIDEGFGSVRFVQFVVEIGIIGLYFAMSLKLQLPGERPDGTPIPESLSLTWLVGLLAWVFAAYLAWDVLDIVQAHRKHLTVWRHEAWVGGIVTAVFTLVFWVSWILSHHLHQWREDPIVWAGPIIALLYLYRVVQEQAKKRLRH